MLVAREFERDKLLECIEKDTSQFITIYGRRRIGKTFLVNEVYKDNIVFSHAGIYKGTFNEQLQAFANKLEYYGLKDFTPPKNWIDAFFLLVKLIDLSPLKKKVIFLDELSWFATKNSSFIKALENFWNSYISSRNDVILVVCASATSWIINNVIHNKGGLHNRVTCIINLKQFNLGEVEKYLLVNKIDFTRKQIIQLYMILGGVPYYLSLIRKDLSFAQNIDYLFVGDSAPLKNEYEYLYKSIFESPEKYIDIIKTLASGNRAGLSREELLRLSNQVDNGNFSEKITELEECGFIRKYNPFGKLVKNSLIQLIDNFTLFYFKFLLTKPTSENFFSSIVNTGKWNSWSGLAFERVCFQHISQIKDALKIGGIQTDICSFYVKKQEEKGIYGSQIDLLIVRSDKTINLCEMKFSTSSYLVSNNDVDKMEIRRLDLISTSKTKYAIIPTLIVHPDVVRNSNSYEFSAIITSDSLFR